MTQSKMLIANLVKAISVCNISHTPLSRYLDLLTIAAHRELQWRGQEVSLDKLRKQLHPKIVNGNMRSAEAIAAVAAGVVLDIIREDQT